MSASWVLPTVLFVVASLAVAFGLTEWVVRRRRNDGGPGSTV